MSKPNSAWYTAYNNNPLSASTIYISQPIGWINIDFGLQKSYPVEVKKQEKVKRGIEEGYECSECSEFYHMAELNQPSGATEFYTFKCYSCRNGLRLLFK